MNMVSKYVVTIGYPLSNGEHQIEVDAIVSVRVTSNDVIDRG